MLTRKFLTLYGFVGIGVMAVLLVLIWLKIVPPSWYLPLFLVALAIWLSRFWLRAIVKRKEQREEAQAKTTAGL